MVGYRYVRSMYVWMYVCLYVIMYSVLVRSVVYVRYVPAQHWVEVGDGGFPFHAAGPPDFPSLWTLWGPARRLGRGTCARLRKRTGRMGRGARGSAAEGQPEQSGKSATRAARHRRVQTRKKVFRRVDARSPASVGRANHGPTMILALLPCILHTWNARHDAPSKLWADATSSGAPISS